MNIEKVDITGIYCSEETFDRLIYGIYCWLGRLKTLKIVNPYDIAEAN